MPDGDLLPGQLRVELLQPGAHPAAPADRGGLLRPPAATVRARLDVVVTGKTKHHQVCFRVVAALEYALDVVNLELPVGARDPADLAPAASVRHQLAAS